MHRFLFLFALMLFGSPRDLNEKGNKLYRQGKYKEALEQYKKAQVKDPKLMMVDYNIGCSQYKAEAYNEASQAFTRIISSLEEKELKEKAVYNLGNVLFKSGDLESSIEAYKQVLRTNPDDLDAKINLEFAQKILEESKKQKQKNKDKKQNEDKHKKQKQKNKDKKQNEDKQEQKDKKEQDKKQQQKAEKQEQKFSKEAAKSLLEALQQDEKKAKEKSTNKGKKGKIAVFKDW